jgi:ATP-dependent Clp protease ATP-binding subunit ClpA
VISNINIKVINNSSLCSYLSKEGYDSRFSARSLERIINNVIEVEVHRLYLNIKEEIDEGKNDKKNIEATI